MIYRFTDFALDTEGLELTQGGKAVEVEPQVFSLLACLIEHRDRVVTKDEIIEIVWDGRIVSDGALNSRINSARRAVGDDGKAQAVIKTFPRRGFRFIAEVDEGGGSKQQQLSTNSSVADKSSIAVLQFDNLSGDPEQDFIGDGLSDDIINGLSRLDCFFVIARNSTFSYKGSSPDVRVVARELDVRYVVEGSVRKSGDRIRVSVQLIDGHSGHQIWSERFDRDYTDIFAVQDEITQTLIGQIEPQLSRAEARRAKTKPPENLDAWELYHLGQNLLNSNPILERYEEAGRLFRLALERDPALTQAQAGLAYTETQFGLTSPEQRDQQEYFKRGHEEAQKAVAMDSQNGFAQLALGRALSNMRDNVAALIAIREAVRLNPNNALARHEMGLILIRSGHAAEGVPHIEMALKLSPADPLLFLFQARMAIANLCLKNHAESVEWATAAIQNGAPWPCRVYRISALGHLDRQNDADQAIAEMSETYPAVTINYVQKYYPITHQPYMEHLLHGLRETGMGEE